MSGGFGGGGGGGANLPGIVVMKLEFEDNTGEGGGGGGGGGGCDGFKLATVTFWEKVDDVTRGGRGEGDLVKTVELSVKGRGGGGGGGGITGEIT